MIIQPPAQELDLREALDRFNADALKEMATRLGLQPGPRAKSIAALLPVIGTEAHRRVLERELRTDDWELLNLLPLRSGVVQLRLLREALKRRGTPDASVDRQLVRLLARCCLLPATETVAFTKFGLPPSEFGSEMTTYWSVAPNVGAWAREQVSDRDVLPAAEPPQSVAPAALTELQQALFALISETSRRPLKLTAQKLPYRTELSRLVAAFRGDTGARRGVGVTVPPILSFALAALVAEGLLVEVGGLLRPSPAAASALAAPPPLLAGSLLVALRDSRYSDLARIPELRIYGYAENSLTWGPRLDPYSASAQIDEQAAREFLIVALIAATSVHPETWLAIDAFAQYVYGQNPEFLVASVSKHHFWSYSNAGSSASQPHHYPGIVAVLPRAGADASGSESQTRPLVQGKDWRQVEGAFVQEVVLGPLRWLGLIEVGSAEAPDRFRLTPLGRTVLQGQPPETEARPPAARALIVQPNFEIVVTDTAGRYDLLLQLDAFAERVSIDRASTYRLTRAALVEGMSRGVNGQDSIELLERANAGPLPQNVRYSLDEWIALYEALRIRKGLTLLEADSAEQLDRWLADPTLAACLGERLSPTVVLVPTAAELTGFLARAQAEHSPLRTVNYGEPRGKLLGVRPPDLILLPRKRAEPYVLYRLGGLAERSGEQADAIAYRLTPASLRAAVDAGWKAPGILAFLEQASGAPPPVEVQLRVLGWSGAVAPVRYESLLAVALPEKPAGWALLRRVPAIERLIRSQPGPEVVLIAVADLEPLRAALAELGIELGEGRLHEQQLRSEASDLRSVLARSSDDPKAILSALKSLKLLGKLDRARWYG